MKILFEFFPILLFFLAYKFGDIYIATGVAIAASIVQVIASRIKSKKFEKMHLITLATITILGGATIYLRNEMFIKWKPTILYWVMALVFFGSQFIGKQTIIERMMQKQVNLSRNIWLNLNFSWVFFFLSMGTINLYVVYNYSTDTWVTFKLVGTLALTLTFIVIQGIYISKHFKEVNNNE
jgi:intracellular septation protein